MSNQSVSLNQVIKIKFKIGGMHCASCAMNIDGELEDTEGITESTTNYAKQETQVIYDDSKIKTNKIIEILKNLGYSARLEIS